MIRKSSTLRIHPALLLLVVLVTLPACVFSQGASSILLKENILKVIDSSGARVGVALYGLDFKDSLFVNETYRYPMQSVYKFPLAIAILDKTDRQLSLNQKVYIPKRLLDYNTWSPMVKDFPGKDIELSLSDLLIYTVSKSDNNGCDALFRLAGGTGAVNNYIHGLGVREIAIAATEGEMKMGWQVQYTNWCQPSAMMQLLTGVYRGKYLSKKNNDFLLKIMTESENSANRIRGLLPPDAVVAHKTGTSHTNDQGMIAATNDAGIVTLPDGRHYAIVVYVSDYTGGYEKGERIIADISRLAWDYFSAR